LQTSQGSNLPATQTVTQNKPIKPPQPEKILASIDTLRDIENQRNPTRIIEVVPKKTTLKINQDYLDLRIKNFKEIVSNGYVDQELRLRNSEKMRKLFCEIMCVLCEARKSHCYAEVKVKKADFDLTHMTERFKAPTVKYVEDIFLKDDPKELFVAANELAYNLSEGKNCVSACYWMEWIIEFESICKQRKEKFKCERRVFANVDPKCQMDIIWIIWDIFLNESKKQSNFVQRIISSALNLFCLRYRTGCHKKRRLLMYFIIGVLTEPFSLEEEIVKDKKKVQVTL
jgi:hypothetical protein